MSVVLPVQIPRTMPWPRPIPEGTYKSTLDQLIQVLQFQFAALYRNLSYLTSPAGGGFPDAPADGTGYGRFNNTWARVLLLTGGTLTGSLILAADPTLPLGAATKQYVDAHAGGGGAAITMSDTPPATPASGQAWFDTLGQNLYLWYLDPTGPGQWVISNAGLAGPVGATGATGAAGPTGPAGPGVPVGGTTGQELVKNSNTDYDTKWVTPAVGISGTFWQRIATGSLGAAADRITISGLAGDTDIMYKFIAYLLVTTGNNQTDIQLQLNGDTVMGNYAYGQIYASGSPATSGAYSSGIYPCDGVGVDPEGCIIEGTLYAVSGRKRFGTTLGGQQGYGVKPYMSSGYFQWATTAGQITSIAFQPAQGGTLQTGKLASGSFVEVYARRTY